MNAIVSTKITLAAVLLAFAAMACTPGGQVAAAAAGALPTVGARDSSKPIQRIQCDASERDDTCPLGTRLQPRMRSRCIPC